MKAVADMTEAEREQIRTWIKCWEEVGPILEAERAEQIRNTDTVRALECLDDAFDSAVWLNRPRLGSGLIDQQAIFRRAKK